VSPIEEPMARVEAVRSGAANSSGMGATYPRYYHQMTSLS